MYATREPTTSTVLVGRRAGIACVIGLLAACSSASTPGASPSKATSTASSAPATTVEGFFAHEGRPLLAFERATTALTTGSEPQRSTCLQLTQQVLPKLIRDPTTLITLARRIPDPALARAFGQDVQTKVLVVLGCSAGTQSPAGTTTDPKAYAALRDNADAVKRLLASHHINI